MGATRNLLVKIGKDFENSLPNLLFFSVKKNMGLHIVAHDFNLCAQEAEAAVLVEAT